MMDWPKYPRTYHLVGSKGTVEANAVPISQLDNKKLIIEEKMDGSMVSLGFDNGKLYIRHRNQEAKGLEFDQLKAWTSTIEEELYEMLEERYVMYGEWLYAKHTIHYDKLVHYFLEYDIYDRQTDKWLSTRARYDLIHIRQHIVSVRIIAKDITLKDPSIYLGPSAYISKKTDLNDMMEGLYVKVEDDNYVLERYKYIRKEFLDAILDGGSHWSSRPLAPNKLIKETNIL